MLTIRKGYDTDYLNDAVAKGREGYYTGAVAAGEPSGRWYGAGAELLGLTGEVDAEVMKALYTHGLDPRTADLTDREAWGQASRLGNPPRNYRKAEEIYAGLLEAHPEAGPEQRAELRKQAAASARQSVAFYDVTLSAPKSMTVLWVGCERAATEAAAAGRVQEAAEWKAAAGEVEEALMVGHRAVLDFLGDHAGYARRGHHGGGAGQWVDAHQLVAAQFLQHDSRDHDPQLHVHGAVANKVPCADGTWLALDGTLLTQWKWAAAAVGERVAETYVAERLGARWVTRPDGQARELAGIDPDSTGMFSKRTKAITPRMEQLLGRFRREVGREPTATERTRLHDEAFLSTRAGKVFGGESREGQIARWADEHAAALGVHLSDVARRALAAGTGDGATQSAGGPVADTWSERDVIARALAGVEESKQAWTRGDLMFALSQALPGQLGIRHDQVLPLLDGLADKALTLARHLNPHDGPAGLAAGFYRADGTSTFTRPGAQRYATDAQLLGEAELRAAAVRRGAPAWTGEDAAGVIERFAAAGRVLGADQAAALTGILTSGAAVEVLAAPAGTGKSFLVGALADTWPTTGRPPRPTGQPDDPQGRDAGGEGAPDGAGPGPDGSPEWVGPRVFGLAYGQRQADVLSEEGVTARNIRRWLDGQARLDVGRPAAGDEEFRLRSGDLLVVDEAGAAPTADLVAIHRRAAAVGAKLLLVGDSRQLAAVGAGGALADVAAAGITYELAEVRRFHAGWEGPASLRLREGDADVVGEYVKHGRVVDAGTPEQAETAAARAWLADTIQGRAALLVVGSNEAAARVSAGLRAELIRLGRVQEDGVPLAMPGWAGTAAGVGDLIQARRNAWHLAGWEGNTAAPVNRTTYRVTALRADGGLTVAPVTGRDSDGTEQVGEPMQLPPAYVREHVTLAYASTVHAAHGRTVDVGHAVLGAGTDAAAAYVQLTRGREGNTAFVVTRATGADTATGETHLIAARDAAAVLADAIRTAEDDPNRTALTEAEQAAAQARSTMTQVDPMLAVIDQTLTGRTAGWLDRLAAAGALTEQHRVELAADGARGTLDQLLRTVELAGHDPDRVLRDAVTATPLEGAKSVAQVLHFRIRSALGDKLVPRIRSFADLIPHQLRPHPDAERAHPSAAGLAALAAAADTRRAELGALLAADPPQWAREALGPVPDAAADPDGRAEWESRAGWAGSYRELVDHTDPADPLGAAPPAGLVEKHAIFRAAHGALDLPDAGADEEAMSEGRLRARVAAAQREEVWAPRYVADELDATHEALRTARADATLWTARAAAESDPDEAAALCAAAEEAGERVERLAKQVQQLTEADDARSLWLIETAVTRELAERARYALGLRGIDVDSTDDLVTAQEWFDTEHTTRLAEDPHRPVTEHDLHPTDLDDLAATDHADGEQADGSEHSEGEQQGDDHAGEQGDTALDDTAQDEPARDDDMEATRSDTTADVDRHGEVDATDVVTTDVDTDGEILSSDKPVQALDDEESASEQPTDEQTARGATAGTELAEPARAPGEAEPEESAAEVQDREDARDMEDVGAREHQAVAGLPDSEPAEAAVDNLPPELEDVPVAELPVVEAPEVVDIRDLSAPEASERADPQQRRRVPLPDETAVTVDRARLAVAEVQARRAAEAAALITNDPEPEPDQHARQVNGAPDERDRDEQRREELIRFADHDTNHQADGDARSTDGDGLER